MANPFKIHTGQRKLRQLFFETQGADKSDVVYTLKQEDHSGFPSLYRLYMETDDPTEYRFATQYLDSWDHWETLCQCTWFRPYITKWRRELEIRAKARALLNVRELANNPDAKEAFQANKFLLAQGYAVDKRKAGRPSKESIDKAAREMAEDATSLNDDLARVTGVLN